MNAGNTKNRLNPLSKSGAVCSGSLKPFWALLDKLRVRVSKIKSAVFHVTGLL